MPQRKCSLSVLLVSGWALPSRPDSSPPPLSPNCSGEGGHEEPGLLQSTSAGGEAGSLQPLLPTVGEPGSGRDWPDPPFLPKGQLQGLSSEPQARTGPRGNGLGYRRSGFSLGSATCRPYDWPQACRSPSLHFVFLCWHNGDPRFSSPTPEMLAWSGIMDMKTCEPHDTFKMLCCFLGRIISSVPQLCRCPQWLSHILKDSEMQLASLPNQMGSHICLPPGLAQPQPAGPQQRSYRAQAHCRPPAILHLMAR